MKKLYFYFVVLCALVLLQPARAADFSFNTLPKVGVNQNFQVDFALDTEMGEINAIEGNISFDSNIFTLKEVRNTGSVISLWVRDPQQNISANSVEFAGITPGGYNSRGYKATIFSLVFSTANEGTGSITVRNAQALLNDGSGTPAKVTSKPIMITVEQGIVSPPVAAVEDTDPPEPIFAEIIQGSNIADNKWVVVFYGQDKKSGISHYEVAEQKGNVVSEYSKLTWQPAQSPYVLLDQTRESFTYIKAVDKAGNETVRVVSPQPAQKIYQSLWLWCIIILLSLLLLGGIVWRTKKYSSRV
ncbi:MAG: hypothetical protein HYT15_00025 [Candidatus Magasanikbacteria bacterium]|nr:hypothetical protein [Candidatus Magasanikbacteria bacterium]